MALPITFLTQFSQRTRNAATQRDATLAQNAYSRFLSQQRGGRQMVDLDRGMTRGLEGLGAGYGQRGLRNSGIFGQAQSDYSQGWMQQRQDITDTLTASLRQAEMGDQQAWGQYQSTVQDLEAEKQALILQTAASLDEFRPFLGA